ncbi:MAG: hypothetical protein R2932_30755 [Caldilineaceae bacterium]
MLLLRQPLFKLGRWLGNHQEQHTGVLNSTEFGARAAIITGAVRLNGEAVGPSAGIMSNLPWSCGTQKLWTTPAAQGYPYRLADGYVDLIGRYNIADLDR